MQIFYRRALSLNKISLLTDSLFYFETHIQDTEKESMDFVVDPFCTYDEPVVALSQQI
jgi:hypothetical protein